MKQVSNRKKAQIVELRISVLCYGSFNVIMHEINNVNVPMRLLSAAYFYREDWQNCFFINLVHIATRLKSPKSNLDTHSVATWARSSWVGWPRSEINHSCPSSTDVKNERSHTSTTPTSWCVKKETTWSHRLEYSILPTISCLFSTRQIRCIMMHSL
jgi:hypothetical protein